MEVLGLYEIAVLAGVTPQAVSNWTIRKPDFPQPLATLASGPVWDGSVIRGWLASERSIPSKSTRENALKKFVVGDEYTLDAIVSALGGDTMSYLPQLKGRIVGGRFTSDMNPNAPYTILVGDRPQVRRKAELLAAQEGTIPVFLKQAPNRWRFHGVMRFVSYVTDPQVVQATPGVDLRDGQSRRCPHFRGRNAIPVGAHVVSTAEANRQHYGPDRCDIEAAAVHGRSVTSSNVKQAVSKVILSTTSTASNSLVLTNLTAVALGTFRLLGWVVVICLTIAVGLVGGMIVASARNRPRYR